MKEKIKNVLKVSLLFVAVFGFLQTFAKEEELKDITNDPNVIRSLEVLEKNKEE